MEIRPVQPADLNDLTEIDGTVESPDYLHLEKSGEGLSVTWKLSERQLREKRVERNRLSDDAAFASFFAGEDDNVVTLFDTCECHRTSGAREMIFM